MEKNNHECRHTGPCDPPRSIREGIHADELLHFVLSSGSGHEHGFPQIKDIPAELTFRIKTASMQATFSSGKNELCSAYRRAEATQGPRSRLARKTTAAMCTSHQLSGDAYARTVLVAQRNRLGHRHRQPAVGIASLPVTQLLTGN